MKLLAKSLLPATLALPATAMLVGAWGFAPVLPEPPLWLRAVALTLAIGAACIAAVRAIQAIHRRQQSLHRAFESLCRTDCHVLADEGRAASLPAPALDDPFYETWRLVCEQLVALARDAQDAEHVRASVEIRAQRAMQRCDYLEHILKQLPEPLIAVNQYDELVVANASAERLFDIDLSSSAVERRAIVELVKCEKLVEMLLDGRRRKSKTCRSSEVQIADAEGQEHWYNITMATLGDGGAANSPAGSNAEGTSQGAVAILRDISSLKAIQQRNAEFVSAVSHEMKAPLAGIKAYVELLADGEAEDEATREEFLQVINSQADRLQRLIDNLLNLARIEAGVVSVHKKTQSLNELLEEALQVVGPAASQKNIELVSDLSELYLGTHVDRDMMLQAAINLLSNAVKYTRPGGAVTLRSRFDGMHVIFEVQDTGVGLSPEDADKVFEKFYRVKKDKDMATGTGLGLPLAKHIVEEVHGGTLTVDSELGVGSTFTVSLQAAGKLALTVSR